MILLICVHNNFATPDTLLFSSFLSFYKNNTSSSSYLYSFLFFFLLPCSCTKPCWRRHRRMFIKESNEKYVFVTNLVFGGTQVASLDIVYYVFPVLDRMASDFLIGFEWKSHKTDYQGEYLSDVKKNVFIEQK